MKKRLCSLFLGIMVSLTLGLGQTENTGVPVYLTGPIPFSKSQIQDFIIESGMVDLPPVVVNILINIDYDVAVYVLGYTTVDENGNEFDEYGLPIVASGLVVVPVNTCPKDMFVYGHGTVFDRSDVASNLPDLEKGVEGKILGLVFGGNGYIAVLPDYLHLGVESEGTHPYLHAASQASATIDMMRAVRTLAQSNGLGFTGRALIGGYSQGGHAGMATYKYVQEANNWDFEVPFAGLGSGAYDLGGVQFNFVVFERAEDYVAPEFVPYLIASAQVTEGIDPGEVFIPDFLIDCYPEVTDQTGNIDCIAAYEHYYDFLLPDFWKKLRKNNPPGVAGDVKDWLADNSVHDWNNRKPTQMYYCNQDDRVDYHNALVAEANFEDNLPWWLFWMSGLINTTDLGPYLHQDCVIPYVIFSKLRFDLYQTSCWWGKTGEEELAQRDDIVRPLGYFYTEVYPEVLGEAVRELTFFQLDGSVAAEYRNFRKSGEGVIRIANRDLPPGAYAVRVTGESGITRDVPVIVQQPELLRHRDYNPLVYRVDPNTYDLDISLLPEPFIGLAVYDREGNLVGQPEPVVKDNLVTFDATPFRAGSYVLEVQGELNHFFLEMLKPSDQTRQEGWVVYPNPTRGSLNISLVNGEIIESITLHDGQGREVWTMRNLNTTEVKPTVDLPAGMYQLRVLTRSGKLYTTKVIMTE